MINIEDFQKLEIKIGKIKEVHEVPDADKLLRLIIEVGDEDRQVLAGIKEYYPEHSNLVGKEIPVITNLEPRNIRGFESQGMILAASADDSLALLHPDKELPSGSVVR